MRGMMAVISWISGSSSPAAIFGCADSVCSTSVVPERGKPRMKIGCGTSVRTLARGSRRSRPAVKKFAQAVDLLARLVVQIGLPGQFARQPLALRERGPGVVVAAHLVEQPALLQQFVGTQPPLASPPTRRSAPAPRRSAASGPAAPRASAARPGSLGNCASILSRMLGRGVEIAVGFLQPGKAQQGLADVRRRGDGFVDTARGASSIRPWFFRFQARLASRIGSRCAAEFQHPAIVVFADLRPVAPRS